jgi:hypothetical protein
MSLHRIDSDIAADTGAVRVKFIISFYPLLYLYSACCTFFYPFRVYPFCIYLQFLLVMETKRHHVINMQELYNPANFLDSTCFSELNLPSHDSTSSNSSSYYHLHNMMVSPQRKTKSILPKRRHHDLPIIAGLEATPIPPLGCSTQQRFLAEAIGQSVEQSVATPLLLQAGQLPGKRVESTMLPSVLTTELKDDIIIASDTFIDRLFPKDRAPFTVNHKLIYKALEKKGFWDKQTYSFKGMVYSESGMAEWLNAIGKTMEEVSECSLKRLWWHGTCNLPPSGAPHIRKPDLVLLSHEYYNQCSTINSKKKEDLRIDWLRIRSLGEVTSEKNMPPRMAHTVNAKSYLSFILQFDRRFATALSFSQSGNYTFTLTDREGQIQFKSSLKSSGLEIAQRFLMILAFLMFGDDADIGLDPHFERDVNDRLVTVDIDGNRYELKDRIYTVESLLGRGTNVWIVTREDKQFILKDSWVLENLVESEIVHLRAMMKHNEIKSLVPTFVDGGDIKINGTTDSTATYRGHGLIGRHHNQRVHRRIVTGPVGIPLTMFQSKKEFVNALIGVVSGRCHKINIAIIFSACLQLINTCVRHSRFCIVILALATFCFTGPTRTRRQMGS